MPPRPPIAALVTNASGNDPATVGPPSAYLGVALAAAAATEGTAVGD